MMNFFQVIPTELHLNGPNVGFSSIPQDTTGSSVGVATFTGIATANFPYNNTTGSFKFQWYINDTEIFDTFVDPTSNASIESTNDTSTFTLNGITPDLDKSKVYAKATYVAGPDEEIIDYPGEGIGNKVSSGTPAILTAFPSIIINEQPVGRLIGSGNTADFSIEASIEPGSGTSIDYQWQLEGENLSDGTSTRLVEDTKTLEYPTMTITSDAGDNFTLDWEQLSVYSSFVTGREYTLKTSADFNATLTASGGGGGNSNSRNVSGGAGGLSTGTFTFAKDHEYKLIVGDGGLDGASVFNPRRLRSFPGGGAGGYGGGGNGGGGHGAGGGGGGYTGLFSGPISIGNAVIIAGGGGGGSNDPASGGYGGGLNGEAGANGPGPRGGGGGSQSSGGSGGSNSSEVGALQGGPGAAGGGGGYYGGQGGNPYNGCCADGAGGGGSGYIGGQTGHPLTDAVTTGGGAANARLPGNFTITRKTPTTTFKTITTVISGSKTPNLKIFSNDEDYGGGINCKLIANNVMNSPLFSNTVSYDAIPPRSLLNFEAFDNENNYSSLNQNLDISKTFTLQSSTFGSQYGVIQFHASESDIPLRLNINASAGAVSSDGQQRGGEGGTSTIDLTAKRDVEYTIIGISNNSAVFIYEKSVLIAVVGQGGDGGNSGIGGEGGGVGIAGLEGSGSANGETALVPTLTTNGVFGSIVNLYSIKPTLYSGDSIATGVDGGTTISCSKGRNWIDLGVSACSDVSALNSQFKNVDGTTISDSASLYRGFKAGYTITDTKGFRNLQGTGGNGGAGAKGGGGAPGSGGGGGGAGYTNGTATVVSANLGGNSSQTASITFGLQTEIAPIPTQTQTVNFTVTRSAAFNNVITYALTSGSGPSNISFGPNAGTVSTNIQRGSVYNLLSAPGRLRLSGNTLQLEDSSDNDFNDLTVTPDRGNFQNTSTYIADF
jgi:hypothetical protein